MNHAASSALPLSAATRQPQQLRLSVWRRKISCACGGGLLSFNCCRCFCCCCCSLVGAFVCVCSAFFSACHTVLLLNAVGTYVCVGVCLCVRGASLGSLVRKHIYVATCCCISFQNFTIHRSTPGRQAGRQWKQCPDQVLSHLHTEDSPTHPLTYPHTLILYPTTRMTNNFWHMMPQCTQREFHFVASSNGSEMQYGENWEIFDRKAAPRPLPLIHPLLGS